MKKVLKLILLTLLLNSCLADEDGTYIEGQMFRTDNREPVAGQTITIQGIEKIRRLLPLGPDDQIATTDATVTDDSGKFEIFIKYNKDIQYYSIRTENVINTSTDRLRRRDDRPYNHNREQ